MDKKILINSVDPEECRIAVVADDVLEEFYVERADGRGSVGNVYKGRVVNVEPGIQAAFVDLGGQRNGFLHASDCTPALRGDTGTRSHPPPIQEFIRPGQEILVQVTREEIGKKGPTLTTYLSLPGRYVVLMPALARQGVSKRIDDEEERRRLRQILEEVEIPSGHGVIVRTAGAARSREEITEDLRAVRGSWDEMIGRSRGARAPVLIREETDLFTRTMRDILTEEVTEIRVDSEDLYERARALLEDLRPGAGDLAQRHRGPVPIFHRHGIEEQVGRIFDRKVPLQSGGHLVIERTEALVAIDVNSGSFTDEKDLEETAFRTDLEAIPEICRQLRMRDLGGVVIIDFIDVRTPGHQRRIEQVLREHLAGDRARIRVSRLSEFGIVEMTRQRVGPGVASVLHQPCEACGGTGTVPTTESLTLEALRAIRSAADGHRDERIVVRVDPVVAASLLDRKTDDLRRAEERTGCRIEIRAEEGLGGEIRFG